MFHISRFQNRLCLALLSLILIPAASQAGVIWSASNQQYDNVNFDSSDPTATTITGTVNNAFNTLVFFQGFAAVSDTTPITNGLHASHGAASLSPATAGTLFKLVMTAESGSVFTAGDFKMDAEPPVDGILTFTVLDINGNVIPVSSGTNSFTFDHNGQNPFSFTTDLGSLVHTLVIASTVPIADIKQISLDATPTSAIPEPSAFMIWSLIAGIGGVIGFRRRQKPHATEA